MSRERVAGLAGLALAAIALAIWLVASGAGSEADAPIVLPKPAVTTEPPPVLPTPPEPRPMAEELAASKVDAHEVSSETNEPMASRAVAPTAGLHVLVVDPSARPVEGASVATSRWKQPASMTDAEGVARFDVQPGETLRVAATHPDFRFASGSVVIDVQPGSVTELRLQLGEGLQVCLEVQARDGRPIEGACVRIQEGWGNADRKEVQLGSPEDLRRSDDLDRTKAEFTEERLTDARGRCCVNGLRAGPISLHVDAAGFVACRSKRFDVDADGGDLGVIVLDPAVKLGGIVEDAAGPVPGAVVDHMGPMRGRATTDADGRFVLEGQAKIPARVMLHASHPERGQFYSEDLTFAEQPLRIVLEPDVDVRFELTDAQTHERISGTASVERRVPQDYIMLFVYAQPTTFDVSNGRLDLELGYFVESVALRVESYDLMNVPMATILADPDRVLELELTRPVNLLVRVHSAGSGELLANAKLHASQDFNNPKDGVTRHNFLLRNVRFDSEAGGFLVAESDLGVATSDAVRLFVEVQGYAPGAATPIATNGRRICPDTIDIYLEPK